MTTIELKNDLLRMIAETDDPAKLQLLLEWFGIIREEKDWWLEISERERQLILEGRKQLADGEGIPHEQVRAKVKRLLQDLQSAKKQMNDEYRTPNFQYRSIDQVGR
jgi:hypothetical protein